MDDPQLKCQALLQLALGKCRGLLYEVRGGQIDLEEIDCILRQTSLEHMSNVLGVTEEELALDSDEYLLPSERLDD